YHAVEDHLVRPYGTTHGMDLGVARCDALPGPALQPHDAALDERDGADAVPLEFEAPRVIGCRQLVDQLGEHGLDLLGHRLAARILRRIHAVDHPIFSPRL